MSGTNNDALQMPGAPAPDAPDAQFASLPGLGEPQAASKPMMQRQTPTDIPPARLALVKRMQSETKLDRAHWKKEFDRMRQDAEVARAGADPTWAASGNYVVNITQRIINDMVAGLYAKNPTLKVERRKMLDFKLWDGSAATLQAAAMDPAGTGSALIQDVQQGAMARKMRDSLGSTLQIIGQYELDRQTPPFKQSMKYMVRNTHVAGVGYVKLGYQRTMQPSPEVVTLTSELEARIANIERLKADLADDDANVDEDDPEAEELRLALNELKEAPHIVSAEGLRFDFPESDAIIPHRKMTSFLGFKGADYVTEEFLYTCEVIQELFGIDIKNSGVTFYHPTEDRAADTALPHDDDADDSMRVCVWCRYNRKDGLVYWMAEGYKDFLSEPAPPTITLERFYPWFPLTLNMTATKKHPFPLSSVRLIAHQQEEMNRARQALRDHRIANRPKYATRRGALSDNDKHKLTDADAHEVVELDGLQPNQKIEDALQSVRHTGIDQALYDTKGTLEDIQRSIGEQDADMGSTNSSTATESSIAENARTTSLSSNIDDLDELLSEMMQEAGRVLLMEMSADTATRIAGPGAVWPTLPAPDVMEMISLDIEVGSSGRPNKTAEINNFERIAPILMQIPGIKPQWLATQAITRMDDKLDPADAILDGVPSMMAIARLQGNPAQAAASGGALPGNAAAGAPGGAPPGAPGAPPVPPGAGGPPGAPMPPAPPPTAPGGEPLPANVGIPHPRAFMGGAQGGTAPNMPGMQGAAGAMNAPRPSGAVFQPPAMPAPGSGVVPMPGAR